MKTQSPVSTSARRLLLLALAVISLIAPTRIAVADPVDPCALTSNTEIEPFQVRDVFQLMIASYRADINAATRDSNLSATAKAERITRNETRIRDLLTLYGRVVNVVDVVFSFSIYAGFEIPLPMIQTLTRGWTRAHWSAHPVGFTLARAKNRCSGDGYFAVAYSLMTSISANALSFGTTGAPSDGAQWIWPAIAIQFPTSNRSLVRTIGDLQGNYFGIADEFALPTGPLVRPQTGKIGIYGKFENGIWPPTAGMVMGSWGHGGQRAADSVQGEWVRHMVGVGNDGSTFRSPFGSIWNFFTGDYLLQTNYSSSPHAYPNRLTSHQTQDLLDATRRIQEDLRRDLRSGR